MVPLASPIPSTFSSNGSVVDSVPTPTPVRPRAASSYLYSRGGRFWWVSVPAACLLFHVLLSFLGILAGESFPWVALALVVCFLCHLSVASLRLVSLVGLLRRLLVSVVCALAPFGTFCFFVLICGGEFRSLGEVGGLVPLRFWVNPS